MALPFTRMHPSKSFGVNCTVSVDAGAIFVGGADVGGVVVSAGVGALDSGGVVGATVVGSLVGATVGTIEADVGTKDSVAVTEQAHVATGFTVLLSGLKNTPVGGTVSTVY